MPLRVMVLDTWEEIPVSVTTDTKITELKAWALSAANVPRSADRYLVKFRGAEVAEGDTTVASAGFVPNAGLIVMSRRRIAAK